MPGGIPFFLVIFSGKCFGICLEPIKKGADKKKEQTDKDQTDLARFGCQPDQSDVIENTDSIRKNLKKYH